MSELQEVQERIAERRVARRKFLAQAGAGAAGLGLAVAGASVGGAQEMEASSRKARFVNPNERFSVTDEDILNFALNLEYLEAEFYVRAAFGRGLDDADITGIAGFKDRSKRQNRNDQIDPGPVEGGRQVDFQIPTLRLAAEEIATDEEAHVKVLRAVLGRKAVARPALNIGSAFTNAAAAAGLGNGFDAYADDNSFLLAAFIFEDVGVTAYKGAAPFIKNPDVLEAAAGILAVEAYHAGAIRTTLLLATTLGIGEVDPNPFFAQAVQAISNLRDSADGPDDKDQGILNDPNGQTTVNIVPTDANGIAFGRTFSEILGIVYLGGPVGVGGGFFPNGLNGRIR